jgi:DNA adenine methylase
MKTIKHVDPFLRWAGSKKQIVHILSEYWSPSYNRYVEAFMGSASLYFALKPKRALLSDINNELVKTFRVIKYHPLEVSKKLNLFKKNKSFYYKIRNQSSHNASSIYSAARFIYLNRFCFNGLYRTNKKGIFNVPYAKTGTGNLPTLEEFRSISRQLNMHTKIVSTDFENTLNQTQKGDFVYLDPPFAVTNRRIFKQYGPDSFGLEDLERLAVNLNQLDKRKVDFVVSYAHCAEALSLFKKWSIRRIRVRRNISGFANFRRNATELIISNID